MVNNDASAPTSALRWIVGRDRHEVVRLGDLKLSSKDQRKDMNDWFAVHPDVWLGAAMTGKQVAPKSGLPLVHRSHLGHLVKLFAELKLPEDRQFAPPAPRDTFTPRPHQLVGRDFVLQRDGALVADGLRTGKTLTSLLTHDPSQGSLLVLAPLATRKVWRGWFKRLWPEIEPTMLIGKTFKPEELTKSPVLFAHYDIARNWQSMGAARIATAIFDEAHLLTNHKSPRTQAVSLISTYAQRRVFLTGTPMWNKPAGLWSILNMISPGAWGTWFDFATRYADGKPGTHGFVATGTSNELEFADRLREVMIRRVWADLKDDLPPITRTIEVIDLDTKTRRAIDDVVESLRSETDHKTYVGKLAQYRRVVGEQKMERAVEIAKEALASGEPVVIWVWHRLLAQRAQEMLSKAGFEAWTMTGEHSQDQRDKAQEEWTQSTGALIVSMSVGQAGIDLSHAHHAIFAELDFTPAVIAQAEMRTFSPTCPMGVSYLVVDHEADHKIVEVLQTKFSNAEKLQVPMADSAIEVIGNAFGAPETGDLDRLMLDILAGDDGSEDLF